MFDPFQNFLAHAARAHGIGKEVRAAKVCQNFRSVIPEIFKHIENPEKYIDAGSFRENYLVVNVENSAWAGEVIMRKEEIIKAINTKAGEEIIKNLRTQLKQFS